MRFDKWYTVDCTWKYNAWGMGEDGAGGRGLPGYSALTATVYAVR